MKPRHRRIAFYQFMINTADRDVVSYLRQLTLLDMERDRIRSPGRSPRIRDRVRLSVCWLPKSPAWCTANRGLRSAQTNHGCALFSGSVESLTEVDFEQLALDGIECTTIGVGRGAGRRHGTSRRWRVREPWRVTLVQSRAIRVNGQLMDDIELLVVPGECALRPLPPHPEGQEKLAPRCPRVTGQNGRSREAAGSADPGVSPIQAAFAGGTEKMRSIGRLPAASWCV